MCVGGGGGVVHVYNNYRILIGCVCASDSQHQGVRREETRPSNETGHSEYRSPVIIQGEVSEVSRN